MKILDIHVMSVDIPFIGKIVFNDIILSMSLLVFLFLFLFLYFLGKNLQLKPNKKQSCVELIFQELYSLVEQSLGQKTKNYFPFLCTLFLFVLLSNIIGIFPCMKSPTQDLNVCLSLGLMTFFVSHFSGVKQHGLFNYLKKYSEPFFVMIPLNIIGELGKAVSHSFRLFGNIFAGSFIATLIPICTFMILKSSGGINLVDVPFSAMKLSQGVSYLILLPFLTMIYVVIYAFFGLLCGFIQALVFTMLATTYIAGQMDE